MLLNCVDRSRDQFARFDLSLPACVGHIFISVFRVALPPDSQFNIENIGCGKTWLLMDRSSCFMLRVLIENLVVKLPITD